jgi:uncharacterized protein (TIGR03435 family)
MATAGLTILGPVTPLWSQGLGSLWGLIPEKFEAAAIKPSTPSQGMTIRQLSSGRLSVDHASLLALVQNAFDARPWEISGAPPWISSTYYSIDAKAPGSADATTMWRMVRSLLEDRFRMKWHREKRAIPVYVLTVAKAGKLPKPREGSCAPVDRRTPISQAPPGKRALAPCGSILMPVRPSGAELFGGQVQMAVLVSRLTDILHRPVIDQTGFTAPFDLELKFEYEARRPSSSFGEPPGEASGPPTSELSDAPDISTALQQQLGLRVHSDKAPIEIIIIDSIGGPSPN